MKQHQFWIVKDDNSLAYCKKKLEELYAENGYVEVEWTTAKTRTQRQNRALHVYLRELALTLNEKGLDCSMVLKDGVTAIKWTDHLVKEHIWRVVQEAQTEKKSTRDLDRSELSMIYDIINRHLGEKFGVHVPFPER
ncbi:MAG: hypothetical protein CL438_10105 [Acidimicrobiaceae bacterium]|nr:hypothetical protein [Acidimicrobiaceae bacterium]|tara:strand:- start:6975 stop:7385 length:411 start_codon:yes stop_codon:yes gene_type:complete